MKILFDRHEGSGIFAYGKHAPDLSLSLHMGYRKSHCNNLYFRQQKERNRATAHALRVFLDDFNNPSPGYNHTQNLIGKTGGKKEKHKELGAGHRSTYKHQSKRTKKQNQFQG
eukprot:TRINITY_DN9214_c0_g2_i1.p2 TRINITY_DN9214_c0_g2~~TRINITY_DN9214_c0_g2_i1.p2  ORF type:complete len:113 (-),score=11.40 TRINITY_DN9214_c0_g2_i1:252-590(-)